MPLKRFLRLQIGSYVTSLGSGDNNLANDAAFTEDPLQKILPKVKFNCRGKSEGYYADVDFDCEVFHYCKTNGFRFTFICPPKARFNQKQMTCDYDYQNASKACAESAKYYHLNERLYNRNKSANTSAISTTASSDYREAESKAPNRQEIINVKSDTKLTNDTIERNGSIEIKNGEAIQIPKRAPIGSKENKPQNSHQESNYLSELASFVTEVQSLASRATTQNDVRVVDDKSERQKSTVHYSPFKETNNALTGSATQLHSGLLQILNDTKPGWPPENIKYSASYGTRNKLTPPLQTDVTASLLTITSTPIATSPSTSALPLSTLATTKGSTFLPILHYSTHKPSKIYSFSVIRTSTQPTPIATSASPNDLPTTDKKIADNNVNHWKSFKKPLNETPENNFLKVNLNNALNASNATVAQKHVILNREQTITKNKNNATIGSKNPNAYPNANLSHNDFLFRLPNSNPQHQHFGLPRYPMTTQSTTKVSASTKLYPSQFMHNLRPEQVAFNQFRPNRVSGQYPILQNTEMHSVYSNPHFLRDNFKPQAQPQVHIPHQSHANSPLRQVVAAITRLQGYNKNQNKAPSNPATASQNINPNFVPSPNFNFNNYANANRGVPRYPFSQLYATSSKGNMMHTSPDEVTSNSSITFPVLIPNQDPSMLLSQNFNHNLNFNLLSHQMRQAGLNNQREISAPHRAQPNLYQNPRGLTRRKRETNFGRRAFLLKRDKRGIASILGLKLPFIFPNYPPPVPFQYPLVPLPSEFDDFFETNSLTFLDVTRPVGIGQKPITLQLGASGNNVKT